MSNPPQTPFKAAHFDHYASKNFFLKSKKFLAYLIEHLKIRLILNYFLINELAISSPAARQTARQKTKGGTLWISKKMFS